MPLTKSVNIATYRSRMLDSILLWWHCTLLKECAMLLESHSGSDVAYSEKSSVQCY